MGCKCSDSDIKVCFGEIVPVVRKEAAVITETPDPHGGMVLEVKSLDLSKATVSPNSLLSGYTAYDASGNLITGDAKSAITITETPDEHGGTVLEITAVDLSRDTVSPSSLLCGYTAHDAHGNLIEGHAHRGLTPFDIDVCFGEVARVPITDYEKLINKPTINGIEINGDLSLEDLSLDTVYYNTTEYWVSHPEIIGKSGTLYVYSDAYTKIDEHGNTINIASIKIGDGETLLSDLPFISGGNSEEFERHVSDTTIHVDENDRAYWDHKASVYIDPDNSEMLIFTVGEIPEGVPIEPSIQPIPTGTVYIEKLSDEPNSDYNITWQEAKIITSQGSELLLDMPIGGEIITYKAIELQFDFNIRKYIVRLANVANEFDKIVIVADSQTGNLHP